jgi:hypothetical protein
MLQALSQVRAERSHSKHISYTTFLLKWQEQQRYSQVVHSALPLHRSS